MGGPVKKKLCWNCDASVPLESETCMYCGVSIASTIPEGNNEKPQMAVPPPLYGKSSPSRGIGVNASSSGSSQSSPQRPVEKSTERITERTPIERAPIERANEKPMVNVNGQEAHAPINKKTLPPPQFRGKPTMRIREEAQEASREAVSSQKKQPNTLLSLFLLLSGSTFFLFGLVVLLFSDQGALILRWNRDQALIYLGLGIVGLLAGWRFILRIEE